MRAFVFPGQGSQAVGMGRELYESSSTVRAVYDEAAAVLDFDIAALTFEGPMELLSQTDITQPALLTLSTAVARLLAERDVEFGCALGHSLGEYSALVATGAVSFPDALRAVQLRGQAMLAAARQHPGGMAAVLGLDDDKVEDLCAGIDDVWPANFNSPGQVVVSGSLDGLEALELQAVEAGARKVVRLPVSGAFHSPFMAPAAAQLGALLDELSWHAPHRQFFSVCTLRTETGQRGDDAPPPGSTREAAPNERQRSADSESPSFADLLRAQVTAPVRFTQAVRTLTEAGFTEFVEVGPGNVLCGLIRRIAPQAATFRTGDAGALAVTAAELASTGAARGA